MADTAPPRLPSTTPQDANTYAPYAVLAVASLVLAILFCTLLVVLGFMASRSGQPFIQPMMLMLPLVIVVLAFAARRQIINAEGTRAGMSLVNTAWWLAVIGGLGYAAYIVTFQLGVRQDAANSFRSWAVHLNDLDMNDPKNPGFFYVFEGSLEPEKRGRVKIGQAEVLYRQLKPQLLTTRQAFLVRLAHRNRGAMEFEIGALDDWERDLSGQKGRLAVTVKCPEGHFTCHVPMMSRQIDGQWVWQISLTPTGDISRTQLTPYGQKINDLSLAAYILVNEQLLSAHGMQTEQPRLLDLFSSPKSLSMNSNWVESQVITRLALLGTGAGTCPEPNDYDQKIASYFEPVDRGDPVREAEQRRQFVQAWKFGRIMPSGRLIQQNPDSYPIITVNPDFIEIKVPVEIQAPSGEYSGTGARGAIVLRMDDPSLLKELERLRTSAATDPLADLAYNVPKPGDFPLKLHKFESDMKPVQAERMTSPGMPGG